MNQNVPQVTRALFPARLIDNLWRVRRGRPCYIRPVTHGERAGRFLVGGLLLTASAFKGYGLFTAGAVSARMDLPEWMTLALLPTEVILGLTLFTGIWATFAGISALTLFSAFACYSLRAGLQGRPSCGCFGDAIISPWVMLCVDVLAIVLLLRLQLQAIRSNVRAEESVNGPPTIKPLSPVPARLLAVLIPCLTVGLPAGWFASEQPKTSGGVLVVEPEQWIGKKLPLAPHIDIGQELLDGDWIVLLYHHDCPLCQEAVGIYEQNARNSKRSEPSVALIEIPPWDSSSGPINSGCRHGRLDNSHDWFVQTPTHLLLSSGVVRRVSQKHFRSPEMSGIARLRNAGG